jgi:hypothetical protein
MSQQDTQQGAVQWLQAPTVSVPLEVHDLCSQLRSNMEAALQMHCEALQQRAGQWLVNPGAEAVQPPAAGGLTQSQLDALTVESPQRKASNSILRNRGWSEPQKAAMVLNYGETVGTAENSRCSSAKSEPISGVRSPSVFVLSPGKNIANAEDEVQPDSNVDYDCDASVSSTRSSSSPSHLRGLGPEAEPLSSQVDAFSGGSQDDSNSETLPAQPAVSPPGVVPHSPNSFHLLGDHAQGNALLLRSPKGDDILLSPSKAGAGVQGGPGAGVGLADSPLKQMSSSCLPSSLTSFSPALTPAEQKAHRPMISQMSLDSLEHTRGSKKALVYSPLSKRKLAVLEAKQSRLQRVVKSRGYELLSAAFIVFNVVFIALETDLRAQFVSSSPREAYDDDEGEGRIYSFVAANLFCTVFVLDLLLRIHAEKASFFMSREKGWNVFDIVVVLTAVVEVIVHWYEIFSGIDSFARAFLRKFSMLRIIRVLRVVSHTRAVKVIRFMRELRLMVFSLTGTLKSLFWAIVLLFIILLVFGVFFTDGTITYLLANPSLSIDTTKELRMYFGSLSTSIVSLFMAMSGGEDWANLWHALEPLPFEYQGAFLAFITFAILALLNVVTAVFVEAAMQVSQNDKELVVLEEMESKSEGIHMMQQVFEELDTNDSGALSLEEFEKHIEDEKLTAFLASFDLDVSQVRTLFTLLDVDRTGEVDLDEFVSGCLRLKGGAKSLDMAILKYQVEWILHNITSWEKKFDVLLHK